MRLIFNFIIIFFLSNSAFADTIDFYHVYHNDIKIAEFNLHNINDSASIVTLDLSEIRVGDKITLKYYHDFFFIESKETICIIDENGSTLIESKKSGRSYSFDLTGLVMISKRVDKKSFCVRHHLTDSDRINFNNTLFYIELKE